MGVGGHLSVAMTVIRLQCVQTSMALKNKSVFTDSNDTGIQYIKSQASELDPHVPVVDAIQQIFNKLLVFSVKMLNNITISISCGKHKLKQYAKLLKKIFLTFFIVVMNLLNRLSVLLLLLLQTFFYVILCQDRIQRTGISTNHKLFCHSAALTGDLMG